jgi:hypothetical protein
MTALWFWPCRAWKSYMACATLIATLLWRTFNSAAAGRPKLWIKGIELQMVTILQLDPHNTIACPKIHRY